MWKQWVNAALGLVVLAAPFMSLSAAALTWTLAISGIAIAILSIWHALEMGSMSDYRLAHR